MPPDPRQGVQRADHQHAAHRQHHRVQGVPGHPVRQRPADNQREGVQPDHGARLQEGAQPSQGYCPGKYIIICSCLKKR